MTTTYALDLLNLTITATDNGETHGLEHVNGGPCKDRAELRSFAHELAAEGFFSAGVLAVLLSESKVSLRALVEHDLCAALEAYKRRAEGGNHGDGWGEDSDTPEAAVMGMGGVILGRHNAGLDSEVIFCSVDGVLYGVADVSGPWAVEILA